MDDSDEDQRLPHHREPKEFVSFEKLLGLLLEKNIIICLSSLIQVVHG